MPSRPADAIIACTSLHHVADLDRVLNLAAAALVPAGVLIVVEWARKRFDEATAEWCFARLPAPGEGLHSGEEILRALHGQDFSRNPRAYLRRLLLPRPERHQRGRRVRRDRRRAHPGQPDPVPRQPPRRLTSPADTPVRASSACMQLQA